MIKSLSPYDKMFVAANQYMQLAMHVKNESFFDDTLEKLKKIAIGTQLKLIDNKVHMEEMDIPVFKIPDEVNSLQKACQYMYVNCTRPKDESLASIGINRKNNTIVLNSHHLCTDGGACVDIYNGIKDNVGIVKPKKLENVFDVFKDIIPKATDYPKIDINNPELIRYNPRDKGPHTTIPFTQKVYTKSNAFDFKCYNKKTGKMHGLTDALYTNMMLTASALNGSFSKFGVKTMINMRPYMNRKATFENGAVLSKITLEPKNVTPDTTVQELMNKYRAEFNDCLKKGVHYGYLKHYEDKPDLENVIPGTFMILTNVGQLRLGGPFDDVFIDVHCHPVEQFVASSNMHFAVIDENKNDAISSYSYSPFKMSEREATMMLKSIHYGLENIDLDKTLAEALEMVKEYQKNFIKYEYPKYFE